MLIFYGDKKIIKIKNSEDVSENFRGLKKSRKMTLNEYIETEKETEGYESDQEMIITLSNLSSIVEKFKLKKRGTKF